MSSTGRGLTEQGLMTLLGMGLLYGGLYLGRGWIDDAFGIYLRIGAPAPRELAVLGLVLLAALVVSLAPAWRAYRMSLSDGMSIRI